MRKIFILLFLMLCCVRVSFPDIQFGIVSGMSWMSDSKYKSAFAYGAIIDIGIIKYLSLEGILSFQNISIEPDPYSLSKGEAKATPILLALKGRYPILNNKLHPFISIGFGYAFNKFELDSNITNTWARIGFDIKEEIKNSFIYSFGLGAEYYVVDHLNIGMIFIYRNASVDGSWSQVDIYSNEQVGGNFSKLNFNSYDLLLSLKYVF